MRQHSSGQVGPRPRPRLRLVLVGAALLAMTLGLPSIASRPANAAPSLTLTLTLQPRAIQAGSTQTTLATATVKYGSINPPSTVEFRSSGDARMPSSSCPTGTSGTCSITIHAGTTDGPQTITATVSNSLGTASATATLVQYVTPFNVAVAFQNGVNRIAPNGVGQTVAQATVTDAGGFKVPSLAVQFSTDATSNPVKFGGGGGDGQGTYSSTVTAPAVVRPATQSSVQTITATVTSTGASGSSPLTLAYPWLQVRGNRILDDFNRPVTLQGVDGAMEGVDPRTPFPDSIIHMAATPFAVPNTSTVMWGVNTVRVELSDAYWFSSVPYSASDPTPCSTHYQQVVDNVVNEITSRGMLAVLDLHMTPAASTQTEVPPSQLACTSATSNPNGTPVLRAMADAGYAPAFWTQVAPKYKDNPLVAFELFNEPALSKEAVVGGSPCRATVPSDSPQTEAQIWHDGGEVIRGTGTYSVAGMQTLYNAAHKLSPGVYTNNLAIVDGKGPLQCGETGAFDIGPALTNPVLDPDTGLPGPNIVYSSHPYYKNNCVVSTPAATTGMNPDLDKVVPPVAAQYPVVFSEFGTQDACALASQGPQFNTSVIQYAVAHNLGWIQYSWNRSTWATSFGILQCVSSYRPECKDANGNPVEPYTADARGMPAFNQIQATPNQLK